MHPDPAECPASESDSGGQESPAKQLDTRRPFTPGDLVAAGLDRRLIRQARFTQIIRGVYVDAGVPITADIRAAAVLALFDRTAFASHTTAARLRGIPVPTLPTEHVTVLDPDQRRQREGIRCHVTGTADVDIVRELRVSAPEQLFVELASLLDLVDLVVVGDHLVSKGLTTTSRLVARCRKLPGAAGRLARRAAGFVREGVESPMETRLRMLLVLAGLPEPAINSTFRAEPGSPARRYDLSWPAVKVIVEYDGRHHIEREEQWEADLSRREGIDDDGWRILVVTSRGIYKEPELTVFKVWRLLRARGLAGVPSRLSDAWRPHFPGRPGSS
ncbi:MAG TPA: hypothetical protein VGJ41_16445 [Nocardioides sp.]|jgi:hypothetical protein